MNLKEKAKAIVSKHENVFAKELGKYTGPDVKIQLTPETIPKVCKARPIQFAQGELVEQELSRLEAAGIIELLRHLERASPVMTVAKSDGTIRLCGDYKRTLKPVCKVTNIPFHTLRKCL